MTDLKKIILTSDNSTYKNNNVYVGSFNISGSTVEGTNTRTEIIPLPAEVDLTDIMFNGPTDTIFSSDPRPSDAWFDDGYVWVLGDDVPNGYTDEPTAWKMNAALVDGSLVITAIFVQQFIATLALDTTTVNYKLVDYSAFLT